MSQNPRPEEESTDAKIQEIIEDGFQKAIGYSRIPLPVESNLSQFDDNTRTIVSEFLRRILEEGDSYERDRDLDYHAFHSLQLDILCHIIYCEKTIQSLRVRYHASERVEMLKKRRLLLKLLGSTIAWLLLEFDAAYIRTFSKNKDPGFIVGKEGSVAEARVFIAGNLFDDRTLLLHYITSCLRIGDLSAVEGNVHFPIEVKLDNSRKRHRPDRRERRQKKRGDMLWEFFAKKHSAKIVPGLRAIRFNTKKRDHHHWDVLSEAFLEARKKGYSLKFAEEGIAYGVCYDPEQLESLVLSLKKSWLQPVVIFGDLYRHVNGLPEIMPFTLYDIPFDLKKEILFQDIIVFGLADLNGVCNTMTKLGVKASWDNGIKIKVHGNELVMGGNLLDRLKYECLSTETLRNYALSPIPKTLLRTLSVNDEHPSKRERPKVVGTSDVVFS